MKKTFEVNGKKYEAREIEFGEVVEFEDYGVDITNPGKKPISAVVAYFGICSGLDKEDATAEIGKYLENGGDIHNLIALLQEVLNNSPFFRRLQENAEKEAAASKTEKK